MMNKNVESALVRMYKNHAPYTPSTEDFNTIKAELSKIPALEKKADNNLGLFKHMQQISQSYLDKLNAVEEIRYNAKFIPDLEDKLIYYEDNVDKILNRSSDINE